MSPRKTSVTQLPRNFKQHLRSTDHRSKDSIADRINLRVLKTGALCLLLIALGTTGYVLIEP